MCNIHLHALDVRGTHFGEHSHIFAAWKEELNSLFSHTLLQLNAFP